MSNSRKKTPIYKSCNKYYKKLANTSVRRSKTIINGRWFKRLFPSYKINEFTSYIDKTNKYYEKMCKKMIRPEGEFKLLNKVILKRLRNSRTILYRYYNPTTGELRYIISHALLIPDSDLFLQLREGFTKFYSKFNHHILWKHMLLSEETISALQHLCELSIDDHLSYRATIHPTALDRVRKQRIKLYEE